MPHLPPYNPTPRNPTRPAGFSLMEVLVAMGLFLLGFAAVASIFPAGALLQRNANTETLGQQAAANAKALVQAKGLTYHDTDVSADLNPDDADGVNGNAPPSGASTNIVQEFPPDALDRYVEQDRSYPNYTADTTVRDFYWLPLIRMTKQVDFDATPTPSPSEAIESQDWNIFVFVMRRQDGATYTTNIDYRPSNDDSIPGLGRVSVTRDGNQTLLTDGPTGLSPGDPILLNDGTIFRVTGVAGNQLTLNGFLPNSLPNEPNDEIWYAPPQDGGNRSPAVRILFITGAVFDFAP